MKRVIPTDDDGVLWDDHADCGLLWPAKDVDDDFWAQNFKYDTNTGDMSEIIELAKRSNSR